VTQPLIRVSPPYHEPATCEWIVGYRDGAVVSFLRFKKLEEAHDVAARLRDQPHRMGAYAARWQRQYVVCDCGWRVGRVRKAEWETVAGSHIVIVAEREALAARELTRR
jgi:hypothetical protein